VVVEEAVAVVDSLGATGTTCGARETDDRGVESVELVIGTADIGRAICSMTIGKQGNFSTGTEGTVDESGTVGLRDALRDTKLPPPR
jgi:hypothetical protein